MAVLKDLIVHGSSRFINAAYFNSLGADKISANEGVFNKLIATNLTAEEASITDLTATNAKVMGLLDVKGELHTNKWTNSNISNVGGSFYISPTVNTTIASGNTPMSITITGTANDRSFQVSGGNFTTDAVKVYENDTTHSVYATGTTAGWPVGSHVMVTGNVRLTSTGVDYPLGTLTGYLTAYLSQGGFTVGGINSPALETIITELGTSNLKSYDISISMFEIGPRGANSLKPVGIMMTSYGVDNSTYIDIYGGVNTKTTDSATGLTDPNVRIGYLGGIPTYQDSNGNSHKPVGWGIYTDNGYFKGVVVADSGLVGNFTISTDLHSGTTGIGLDDNVYVSPGTLSEGISIANSPEDLVWAFTAGSKFGVTTDGNLYANNANLSNANVEGAIIATSLTIGAGANTYNGVAAINISGYSIEIISGESEIVSGQLGCNLYPHLYHNGIDITDTVIDFTHFKWYKDNNLTGIETEGDSTDGHIFAPYGHTYTVHYDYDDGAVEGGTVTTEIRVDPSKYITQTADTGIKIHPEVQQNVGYIQLDTYGLNIYGNDGTSLANYSSTIRIGPNSGGHTIITSGGMEIFSNTTTSIASFGVNGARIGKVNAAHSVIDTNGQRFYAVDGSTELANIGYGEGNSEDGVAIAPYYTFGMRDTSVDVGNYSLVEGINNIAPGFASHAEGGNTEANSYYSHAEGFYSEANGSSSHAEGTYTVADGNNSHSEGFHTEANGFCSHTQNYQTIASSDSQTAIGKNNIEDNNDSYSLIIGNGYYDNNDNLVRSNALTVDWNGNIMSQGMAGVIQMYAGSTAPPGWLICDGSLVSKTTYAILYAVIGDAYKRENDDITGNYFRLPDLVGRMPIGIGTSETVSDPTTRALGAKAGSERVTLTVDQIPAHTHMFGYNWNNTSGSIAASWSMTIHSGNKTGNAQDATNGIFNTGGGQSHGNMPPYLAINFIIATGITE